MEILEQVRVKKVLTTFSELTFSVNVDCLMEEGWGYCNAAASVTGKSCCFRKTKKNKNSRERVFSLVSFLFFFIKHYVQNV